MKYICLLLVLILLLSLCGCYTPCEDSTVPQTTFPEITTTEPAPLPPETEPPATCPPETEPPTTLPIPDDQVFVRVTDYIPDIMVELKYATEDNFTGQPVYDFDTLWLRYGTVKKLMVVQQELKLQGYCLLIWDGFRPASAQFALWEICPDSTYVADPRYGYSAHTRGNTVDVTLRCLDGSAVEMPTGFDDFSLLANRDYSDCTAVAAENARFLEQCMYRNGFTGYFGEWWHFTDCDGYPVETQFDPAEFS